MHRGSLTDDFRKYVGGEVADEIDRRVDVLKDLDDSAGEYDAFGASRESMKNILRWVYFFYRFYFRTEVHGLENIAEARKALIIPNHMAQTPVDGMNVAASLFFEPEEPRLVRAIGHHVLAANPFVSMFVSRSGQVIGNAANADRLFEGENLVLIFPEGSGAIRPYYRRYRLNRFSPGFMEYAIRYGYPVVPTAIIGSEESTLVLGEVKSLKGFMGIPRFAVSPTFPWLGPLGLVPYPVRFRIYFGEPMDFSGHRDKLGDPAAVRRLVDDARLQVQHMLDEKLEELPRFPVL